MTKDQMCYNLDIAYGQLMQNVRDWYQCELAMIEANPPEDLSVKDYTDIYQTGGWFIAPGVIQRNVEEFRQRAEAAERASRG